MWKGLLLFRFSLNFPLSCNSCEYWASCCLSLGHFVFREEKGGYCGMCEQEELWLSHLVTWKIEHTRSITIGYTPTCSRLQSLFPINLMLQANRNTCYSSNIPRRAPAFLHASPPRNSSPHLVFQHPVPTSSLLHRLSFPCAPYLSLVPK